MVGKTSYEELAAKMKALERELGMSKQTFDAMREERDLLKTIFTLTPDPIVVKDRDSVYRAANPAFCRLLAKPEEEIVGKTDYDFLPRSEAEIYRQHDAKVMETGQPRVQITVSGRGAEKRWLRVSKAPIHDREGTCVGVFCSVSDMTEQKRAEKALSQREADFWKVNKELLDTNRALSVLATNIEKNWKEMEKRIGLTISSKVIPMVNELRKDKALQDKAELDMLATYVNDLTSGLTDGMVVATSLSSMELRIAAMVKNGLTSQEIARQLNISLHTVKTHRKNIRKKLKIQNSTVNLSSYLRSKME